MVLDRSIGALLSRAIDQVGREGAVTIENGSSLTTDCMIANAPVVRTPGARSLPAMGAEPEF